MAVVNLSAAIPYSDATTYPNGTLGKRIQELLSEIISASIPDGSLTAVKLDATDDAAFRVAIGVVIGTDVQAFHAKLDALAGLTGGANTIGYFDGTDTMAQTALSAFIRGLLDDADAATAQTTLGLVIGTNVQAYDAELAALAGLTSAADKVAYFTGSGTAALADFPAAGRALAGSGESKDLVATLNPQTGTTYTVDVAGSDSDRGRVVRLTNAAGITVTLPNSAPVGFYCSWGQGGAGQITFSPASGATLVNRQSHAKSAGQHAQGGLIVYANSGGSAAEWTLSGDTAA